MSIHFIRPLCASTTWNSWMRSRFVACVSSIMSVSPRVPTVENAAQQPFGREVLAGGDELALVLGPLVGVESAPSRIDLQKGVLHEVTLAHGHGVLRIVAALFAAVLLCAPAPARAADEDVLLGGPKVLLAFHPGGGPPHAPGVFQRITDRDGLSVGLLGATQGSYSVRQTLLDLSQGARVSRSGYKPRQIPRLRLVPDGGGWRIAGWRSTVRRASEAPGDMVPGRLSGAIPGGAGFVATAQPERRLVEAIVAADRDGRVAEVSLGAAGDTAQRARGLLRRMQFVVVALPGGPTGDHQLDELLGRRERGEVVIVMRTPPRSRAPQLLPLGAAGLSTEAGLLESRTTRRRGLVAGIDLLPTVLEHLGIASPNGVTGRSVTVSPGRDIGHVRKLERRLRVVYPRRFPALFAVAAALLVAALALARFGGPGGRRRALRVAALGFLWIPVLSLGAAALAPSRNGELLFMALGAVGLGLVTDRFVAWPRGPVIPALGGVVAYVIDLVFGSGLIVRSLLGPNPRFGARFYGIGNELEALLPVVLLIGLAAAVGFAARSRRLAIIFGGAMLVLGVAVGAGRLGADVGGVISIGAGGAAAVLLALDGRPSRLMIAIACAVPIAAIGALALIDIVSGGDSHFTTTILGAESNSALVDVAQRRLSLAWNALLRGLMPFVTLACVIGLVYGLRHRERLMAPVADAPAWQAAFAGSIVAGVIGALANDSGPVLLVFAVIILAFALMYVRGRPAT